MKIGNFQIKKVWAITIGIVLLLIITNPSMKKFKDYQGQSSYKGFRRVANFGIFSVYAYKHDRYVGLFLNFLYIGEAD